MKETEKIYSPAEIDEADAWLRDTIIETIGTGETAEEKVDHDED